jgi:hypothetical protein
VAIESCTCLTCRSDASRPDAGRHDDLVETVRKHGWAPLWIAREIGYAHTVGVYHSFGQAEFVMFGLEGPGMQQWLNAAVEHGRDHGWPADGEPFHGILGEYPTQLRTVHTSWHDALFGAAHRFYQGQPVPVRQLVWPDRHGRWPWDPEATLSSRTRQAQAWLPVAQHPAGGWRLVGELEPNFAFPSGADSWVLTTAAILDGRAAVAQVVRDQAGYDVLDENGYAADDLCLGLLGDVVTSHPHLTAVSDLVDGQVATIAGRAWQRSFVAKNDRRASQRAWTLADPAPRYTR